MYLTSLRGESGVDGHKDRTGQRDAEMCHEHLGDVWTHVRHPVAGLDAGGLQRMRQAVRLRAELAVTHAAVAVGDRRLIREHVGRALEKRQWRKRTERAREIGSAVRSNLRSERSQRAAKRRVDGVNHDFHIPSMLMPQTRGTTALGTCTRNQQRQRPHPQMAGRGQTAQVTPTRLREHFARSRGWGTAEPGVLRLTAASVVMGAESRMQGVTNRAERPDLDEKWRNHEPSRGVR